MTGTSPTPLPAIDIMIVASWFPGYDDEAAGRFVADQAEALAATGIARPAVISFDGVRLTGGATARGLQESTVEAATATAAVALEPLFVAPAWGVDSALPVARLAIAEGQTPASGARHAAVHRSGVLRAIAGRISSRTAAPIGVVHAHTVYPDGAAAADLASRLGWPLFITEHSSFIEKIVATPGLREAYAAAVGASTKVFAVSEMLAGELRGAFPEVADRFEVLPNSVPVGLFRATPQGDRRADELLFVGYRKPSKGIENLLRAVATARARRPSITLRLLGRSPDAETEARWVTMASSLGLADAVSFEEPLDRAGIADAMARAALFVHPSPRETFGVVAVEALASGLPVVATDSGGVTEILGSEPARVGALVPADDHDALADAILATLDRLADFEPDALRASVERRFGSAHVAERLLVEYREALVRGHGAGGHGAGGAAGGDPAAGAQAAGGAAAIADAPAGPVAPPDRLIVVALDRARAGLRLGPLPDALRERFVLLTATAPRDLALPAVGRVVEVDVEPPGAGIARAAPAATRRPGLAGRLARLVTDPRGTIGRRIGRGPGSESALEPAVEALVALLGEVRDVEVLPLDGHDHLAVAAAARRRPVELFAGGVRRLADAWRSSRG